MKTLRLMFLSLMVIAIGASCEEEDGGSVGPAPVASFTAIPSTTNPNYIVLEVSSENKGDYMASWRLKADASITRDNDIMENDTVYYAEEGTYNVTLYIGSDAGLDSASMDVMIGQRDQDLPPIGGEDPFVDLGDFENGEIGNWNQWGQDVTVADNPASDAVNSSSKVLKMTQTGGWETAAVNEVDASILNDKAIKVTVDVYFEQDESLKMNIDNDLDVAYYQNVTAGSWVTLEFNLEGEIVSGGSYPRIAFQSGTGASFYLDNIKYYGLDVVATSSGVYKADFEDGEIGDWNQWGQEVAVADNPASSASNSSSKVMKMTQTGGWQAAAVNEVVSALLTPETKRLTVDVYFEADGQLKLNVASDLDVAYYQDVVAGEWVNLEFDLTDVITATGSDFPRVAFQSGAEASFYVDNITIHED
ncbi:MAG: hypothetical protein OCD76_16610 [Reichenbachiella sp.]